MVSLSGSNLAIGISLVMRDGFSAQSRIAGANMDALQAKAHRLATQQLTMARNANAAGAAIGAAAIYGLGKWVDEGAKFNYTMKYVATISGGVGKEFDRLNRRAVTLGESTMFTAIQIADGMRWMAQAGMDATSIYNSMGAIANLAGSTMSNIEGRGGAADWVTNIAKAFDIQLNEKNVTKISDVLSVAVNKSNMKLYEFGEAMKYAQATAKDLNMTFEETSAGIMVLANAGIQGTMAGTAIENMLRYVTKASGSSATSRQLNALGVLGMTQRDLQDAKGNLLSYGAILEKVSRVASKMGNVQAQNALIDLFGVRGKRAASTIANKMMDYSEFLNMLNNSGGKSAGWMKDMMSTAEGSILQLTSAWTSFKIAFFESLEPVLVPFIKSLTGVLKIINAIARTRIGKLLMIGSTAFLILKTAGMAYRSVLYTIQLLTGNLGSTMVATGAKSVANLNNMTGAANRYGAAMARANAAGMGAGFMGLGGFKGITKTGYAQGPQYRGPSGRFMSKDAAMTAMYGASAGKVLGNLKNPMKGGKFGLGGKLMKGLGSGKGFGIGLIASLVGGLGSEAVGTDTTVGKGLGVLGDTASYAMTGGAIGSIFPGIGTAIGAVVGGIGGLLWGIYDKVVNVQNEVQSVDTVETEEVLMPGRWKKLLSQGNLKNGYMDKWKYEDGPSPSPFFNTNKQFTSTIVVNLNGNSVYSEAIDEPNHMANVDIGIN